MNKKQKRQQKMLRQQEIVDAAKNAGRDLTAEEQTEFDFIIIRLIWEDCIETAEEK